MGAQPEKGYTVKRTVSLVLSLMLLLCAFGAVWQVTCADELPPAKPEGDMQPPSDGEGQPPEKPSGEAGQPPEMPSGEAGQPPEMPGEGQGNPPSDMPMGGGMSQGEPESYTAVRTLDADTEIDGETIYSEGTDENALLVTAGHVDVSDSVVIRENEASAGGDDASFYGVGAALLCTGGKLHLVNTEIRTDANGAAGAFAYGEGTVTLKDCEIFTTGNTAGGIHAAGGGTLSAENVTVVTEGASSAAIRSDRGGGTMTVTGGSYTSKGTGSPAVYCTADITVSDAALSAEGSEAVCIEGFNSLTLNSCTLEGYMRDDTAQNDCTWNIILYQSMSGDSEIGCSTFTMNGGTLTAHNGGMFYTTNTQSIFNLSGVTLVPAEENDFLLRCTGNSNARGWGKTGANGADCAFNANAVSMVGDVYWDSISTLAFTMSNGSSLTGAFLQDESCTGGNTGSGSAALLIGSDCVWTVTGDSVLTDLTVRGSIADADGREVKILAADGTVLHDGASAYTITVTGTYTAE